MLRVTVGTLNIHFNQLFALFVQKHLIKTLQGTVGKVDNGIEWGAQLMRSLIEEMVA
jgi:hypothetical protein